MITRNKQKCNKTIFCKCVLHFYFFNDFYPVEHGTILKEHGSIQTMPKLLAHSISKANMFSTELVFLGPLESAMPQADILGLYRAFVTVPVIVYCSANTPRAIYDKVATRFFLELLSNNNSKKQTYASALRQAQLHVMRTEKCEVLHLGAVCVSGYSG